MSFEDPSEIEGSMKEEDLGRFVAGRVGKSITEEESSSSMENDLSYIVQEGILKDLLRGKGSIEEFKETFDGAVTDEAIEKELKKLRDEGKLRKVIVPEIREIDSPKEARIITKKGMRSIAPEILDEEKYKAQENFEKHASKIKGYLEKFENSEMYRKVLTDRLKTRDLRVLRTFADLGGIESSPERSYGNHLTPDELRDRRERL